MIGVEVMVKLDDSLFWKLAGIAEQFDMRVDQYLSEVASVASRRKQPSDSDPVLMWWRQGLTDREICAELGLTRETVGDRRRRIGLPANRRRSA